MRNNKNICILPFISMDRNPYDEGLPAGPCCMYQQQKEKIYDFKTYWHSNELKELRDTFRKKQKPHTFVENNQLNLIPFKHS